MDFPRDGLMPKVPSESSAFVSHHAEFDGRGVVVAVLDTGVDPGAAGLQRTSDGRKKIIGLLDTSGGGDVDTSMVVKGRRRDEDACVEVKGASGKTLVLPASVENPSGEWHVGKKAAFELFPGLLVKRVKGERKKEWARKHAQAMAKARVEMEEVEKEQGDAHGKVSLGRGAMLKRNEVKARVEYLENCEKNWKDLGPVADVVVWKGPDEVWRAMVDTGYEGDLREKRPLRHFAAFEEEEGYEFDKWDSETQLNFAVNIFQNGNLVSIVVDSSAHGTHVASITAGYHPDAPEMTGVAPGAQIISMRIGDGRIDGMETGAAIIRALNACAELGVDVINMSFGEPTRLPDAGRVAELARELVEKHGVVFVSSAGNAGPALSTVGAPGSTSEALIGVGAYVEPQMMLAAYAMKPGLTPAPINYTWSSRGPAYNGLLGVTVSAPGAAIVSVPEWTLTKSRLMNGTSMAAPNAAGGIALIISGLKARGIKYSPWTIKRAIQATAAWIPGVEAHAQGRGLIQVAKAFDALSIPPTGVHSSALYNLQVSSECRTNAGSAQGIYIREPWESQPCGIREFVVNVTPSFPEHQQEPHGNQIARFAERIFFDKKDHNLMEVKLNLRCTQSWISAPPHLFMNSATKGFKVSVDLSALPTSSSGDSQVPFGYVEAYDPCEPASLGPLWAVPVTVIRAETCDISRESAVPVGSSLNLVEPAVSVARLRYHPFKRYANIHFGPGKIVRHFITVPTGASWMDVYISSSDGGPSTVPVGSTRTFYLHCIQMNQQSHYRDDELSTSVQLLQEPGASSSRTMAVVEGGCVEVCVAQYWSSLGEGPIDLEIKFNGVTPNPSHLVIGPKSGGVARVELRANLSAIGVCPAAKLTHWSQALRPDSALTKLAVLSTLDSRDAILGAYPPSKRPTYGLTLTYKFNQAETGKLTPRFPLLDKFLYESPFDSQMCMLFDSNQKLLCCLDAWPDPVEVPKGEIVARIHIRHEDRSKLERLEEMPMVLDRALGSEICLDAYKTYPGAVAKGTPFRRKLLQRGETCAAFLAAPSWKDVSKKLPKGIAPGDVLHGHVSYGKRNKKDTVGTTEKRPGGYPLEWIVITPPKVQSTSPALKDEEDASHASGEKGKSDTESTSEEMLVFQNLTLPLLKAKIKVADGLKDKEKKDLVALFDTMIKDLETMISQVPSVVREDAKTKSQLEQQSLLIARLKLLQAVRLAKPVLPIMLTEQRRVEYLSNPIPSENQTDPRTEKMIQCCNELISLVRPSEILLELAKLNKVADLDGVGTSEGSTEAKKVLDKQRRWLEEALVLKIYASWFQSDRATEELLNQIASSSQTLLNQLRMDRHVYHSRFASALQILEQMMNEKAEIDEIFSHTLNGSGFLDHKLQLLSALKWYHLSYQVESSERVVNFPGAYPLF